MAPAWVLLDSCVRLRFDEEDDGSAAAAVDKATALNSSNKASSPLFQTIAIALLGSMKPDAVLAEPPGIATFRLLGSKAHQGRVHSLCSIPLIACADKSLLVFYAGPGSFNRGCYIVFDAAAPLVSTVPPLPLGFSLTSIGGKSTVALRHQPPSSAYLLAELTSPPSSSLPDAELYLWRSDEPTPQWAQKTVRLPSQACWMPGKHYFFAETSFSRPVDTLCWVDLLHGIIVCTNPTQDDPELRFIPFPDDCPAVGITDEYPNRPHMEQFRCAACVGGAIKLVTMVGVLEGWDMDQFRLTAWTLSPNLTEWQQDGVFPLKDLWAADEYHALELGEPQQCMPICPVLGLGAREDAVFYAAVNDLGPHNALRGSMVVTETRSKGQYLVGIDIRRNKIISTSPRRHPKEVPLKPSLHATDFPAYLQGEKGRRQREVEASNVEAGKRLKVV